jgi:maltooligosyltrehalose trehalohydrolase
MLFMGEEWGAGTPWQFFTAFEDETLAAAVRTGRRTEFATHGWAPGDVPDPQDPATLRRSRIDWTEPTRSPHAELLALVHQLVALRRSTPALGDGPLPVRVDTDDAGWLVVHRGEHRVVVHLGAATADIPLGRPLAAQDVLLAWGTPTIGPDGTLAMPPASAVVLGPGVSG